MNFLDLCLPIITDPMIANWCECTLDSCDNNEEELTNKIQLLGLNEKMSIKDSMPFWNKEQKASFFKAISSDKNILTKVMYELNSDKGWMFKLRPKQIIDLNGNWRLKIIQAGRGWGKALKLSTPILTTKGWKTMGELEIGDKVYDENGKECNVTAIFEPEIKKAYRLHFSDNTFIDCCEDHQWVTVTRAERKRLGIKAFQANWANKKPISTREIIDTFKVGKDFNHCIPACNELDFPEKDLPIDPYLFGCWLGDGHSNSGAITCHKDDSYLLEKFGYVVSTKENSVLIRVPGLTKQLRELGVLNNKHIPNDYLFSSKEQRLALLSGLMDTDGSAYDNRVEFCNKNKNLADGVLFLARSLGQTATLSENDSKLYDKNCGKRYRVRFHPTKEVFRLARKNDKLIFVLKNNNSLNHLAYTMLHHYRMIKSYEEIIAEPMRCITVDSDNHMYLASEALIPTHNSMSGLYWLSQKIKENYGGKRIDCAIIAANLKNGIEVSCLELISIMDEPPSRFDQKYGIIEYDKYNVKLYVYTAESPEAIRGGNFAFALCEELANWINIGTTFSNTNFATRIKVGNREPKILVTTTPTTHNEYGEILQLADSVVLGKFFENCRISGESFVKQQLKLINTQKGRIELLAQLGDTELPWQPDHFMFDEQADIELIKAKADRIVVAVDPAMSTSKTASETGICVAAKIGDYIYILEDGSGKYSPQTWSLKVAALVEKYNANYIVAEVNHGHDLVLENLKANNFNRVPVRAITAGSSKIARAEPIITLHETRKVIYAGSIAKFRLLYEQCISYDPVRMTSKNKKSPDRHDAMVWAIHSLVFNKRFGQPAQVINNQPMFAFC